MGIFISKDIRKGSLVSIHNRHFIKYLEHRSKIFKVLDIDEDGFCALEWINPQAVNRMAYIPKEHLIIS